MRVIVQAEEGALSSLRFRLGRGLRRNSPEPSRSISAPRELSRLVADGNVAHLSGDLPVVADMAITNKVTRADKVWAGSRGLLGLLSQPGVVGQRHRRRGHRFGHRRSRRARRPRGRAGQPRLARAGRLGRSVRPRHAHRRHDWRQRGRGRARDAGVRGRQRARRALRRRPRARQQRHPGYTSDVIAGIDWTIANARRYGIRIINLSLGHPVTEPSATDPLCRAVARAVQAGLVVVVSAGNHGQTATGTPILGGITSPGNSPFAITVGALDAMGTVDRADDRVAPYSSRGPTKFDFAVKPDVVAPGAAHRLARESSLVAEHALSRLARRRQRPQRLLPVERDQHVGRRRERRRRAAPRRRAGPDAGAGQGRAPDRARSSCPRRDSSAAARAASTSLRRSGSRRAGSLDRLLTS